MREGKGGRVGNGQTDGRWEEQERVGRVERGTDTAAETETEEEIDEQRQQENDKTVRNSGRSSGTHESSDGEMNGLSERN